MLLRLLVNVCMQGYSRQIQIRIQFGWERRDQRLKSQVFGALADLPLFFWEIFRGCYFLARNTGCPTWIVPVCSTVP